MESINSSVVGHVTGSEFFNFVNFKKHFENLLKDKQKKIDFCLHFFLKHFTHQVACLQIGAGRPTIFFEIETFS